MMAGGYDPSRDGLAKGCCSALAPCSHQQRSPHTICRTCWKAAILACHAQGFTTKEEAERAIAEYPPPQNGG